jgi:thymidylate synthase (FAD)
MPITLRSEITVEEIQAVGSDDIIVHAARVSTRGNTQRENVDEKEAAGLIRYLMRSRHGTPFEHGCLTVRVHAPIKVWREWHRHRVGWSYNETSGRYQQLEPVFWIPPRERPMLRPEGFRSANPSFELASEEEYEQIGGALTRGYEESYARYEELLALGVDRGLARDVLGVGIFSSCYCTANPRSIMAFLELRTNRPDARRPSKPLWEIANAAEQLEAIFASHWPITHAAFCEFGRMAP